jgi:hypothetical protein
LHSSAWSQTLLEQIWYCLNCKKKKNTQRREINEVHHAIFESREFYVFIAHVAKSKDGRLVGFLNGSQHHEIFLKMCQFYSDSSRFFLQPTVHVFTHRLVRYLFFGMQ